MKACSEGLIMYQALLATGQLSAYAAEHSDVQVVKQSVLLRLLTEGTKSRQGSPS